MRRVSAAQFCWDIPGFGPQFVILDNEDAFLRLYEEVQGDVTRITDTEASRALYGSYEALQLVIQLRDLYMRKTYRGRLSSSGKVVNVQFSSTLTPEEDNFLESNLAILRGLLNK